MIEVQYKTDPSKNHWYEVSDILPDSIGTMTAKRLTGRSYTWRPPTDVYETENTVIVRIEIAGMQETDFTISLRDRYLLIKGVRQDIPERRAYHLMEIRYGEFMSEVELPVPVVVEEVQAEYRSGFLTVVLPKPKPRQIRITDV